MNFLQFLLFSIEVGFYRWDLVILSLSLVGIFLYGVLRPRRKSEWRSAGIASAWVIALYAEMYGFPLTLYLLSHIFGSHLAPSHFQNGHIWAPLLQVESPWGQFAFVLVGQVLILLGTLIALVGWRHLWPQRNDLATQGIYAYIRHPQYTGFFLFLLGSLVNWPTLITLLTAPILIVVYYRLALQEERDALEEWGERYQQYMDKTGRFWPRLFTY